MVKSGLINDITVSHYRLSIHLITAIFIISIIFWLIKNITSNANKNFFNILDVFFKTSVPFTSSEPIFKRDTFGFSFENNDLNN